MCANLKETLIIEAPAPSLVAKENVIKDVNYLEGLSLCRLLLYMNLFICFCPSPLTRMSAYCCIPSA